MRLTEEQMIQSRIDTAVSEALKEQMERVMGVIETEQSDYGRENDGYKALEYVKQALKVLLEGENG